MYKYICKLYLQIVLTVAMAFIVDAFQFKIGLNSQKFTIKIGMYVGLHEISNAKCLPYYANYATDLI